jgi:hypothetical protein
VVFDESKYKEKLNTLLECGVYKPLPKDPTAKVDKENTETPFQAQKYCLC